MPRSNIIQATLFCFLAMLVNTGSVKAGTNVEILSSSKYAGKTITLTGELRKAGGSTRGTVILLHGCGGLQGPVLSSLRSHASSIRSAGFSTLILDSFNPRGISGGWVCGRDSRLASAQAYRQRDVRDAIKFLQTEPGINAKQIYVMGQSNGGSVVSILAKRPVKGLRAAVAFYPWCGAVPSNPRTPLLVLSGEADDWTPPARCKSLDKSGDRLTVVTYPNAVHSFDLSIPVQTYQGHKVGGSTKARADARRKMISFFKQN